MAMTPDEAKKFKYWQTRTIIASMVGYALFYFVRKNLSIAMPAMQADLGITKTELGIFLTLHDKVAETATSVPRNSNVFRSTFGPLNYSFNRGEVHFVCLDDVLYSNSTTYTGGFSDDQVEWLKQDLNYVSKSKMVILYYHIPLRNTTSILNRNNILELLKGFSEVHLMSGHTHYSENCAVTTPLSTYEHIHVLNLLIKTPDMM